MEASGRDGGERDLAGSPRAAATRCHGSLGAGLPRQGHLRAPLGSPGLPGAKPSSHDEFGNPIYTASDTRPLCVVDTASRLIANAARLRWEQNLGDWLAKERLGFLPRRSMLSNVVDLELTAMRYALAHSAPAIMIFEFAAAFPAFRKASCSGPSRIRASCSPPYSWSSPSPTSTRAYRC